MTQPESQNPKLLSDTLLEDLKDTPTGELGQATRRAEHFTPEDDDSDRRFGKAQRRRTFQKIQRWFFWFLFWLTCAVTLVLAGGYIFLVWKWVSTLIWDVEVHNPSALKAFIDGVLWSLLIVFATLFLEGVFRDRRDD